MSLASIDGLSRLPHARLRAWLRESAYSEEILAFAERIAPGMFDPLRVPLVTWALRRRDDPASRLARLFAYDDAVERASLNGWIVRALMDAGVLVEDAERSDCVRSLFLLLPLEGLWILSDPMTVEADCVMGPGPTTQRLIWSLPGTISGTLLDVGCGAGTIALVGAQRGARSAVGTDINPRAVAMARFNAHLNDLSAEFACGDLSGPVQGARFSIVVSQPPYVVCPSGMEAVTYLHGGPRGDEIAMRLIESLPDLLERGGVGESGGAPGGERGGRAYLLIDAAVGGGEEPLYKRIRAILRDAPVDLLILTVPGAGPDIQAIGYAVLEDPAFGRRYGDAARRYREHLDTCGVREFNLALVMLRMGRIGARFTIQLPVRNLPGRQSGRTSGSEGADAAIDANGGSGPIERLFDALDLAALDDAALCEKSVRLVEGIRFVEERQGPEPGLTPNYSMRFPVGSIAKDYEISEAGYVLSLAIQETETIEEAVGRYAEICGATREEVRSLVLDFVRQGLSRGALVGRKPGATKTFDA